MGQMVDQGAGIAPAAGGGDYGGEPALGLIADSREALDRLSKLARLCGYRVVEEALVGEPRERDAAVDALVAILDRPKAAAAELFLKEVARESRTGRRGCALAVPRDALALVEPIALDPGVEILVDPTLLDWAAGLAAAASQPGPRLRDVRKGRGVARLQQLSQDIQRIAGVVSALAEDEAVAAAAGATEIEEVDEKARVDAAFVRSILRARRLRNQFFHGDLFADPAWDMLLDLMASRLEGKRVAVSSLCIASAVPATTALRWIKALCDRGLFVRTADPGDGRRVFIELSDDTAGALDAYLREAQRMATLIA